MIYFPSILQLIFHSSLIFYISTFFFLLFKEEDFKVFSNCWFKHFPLKKFNQPHVPEHCIFLLSFTKQSFKNATFFLFALNAKAPAQQFLLLLLSVHLLLLMIFLVKSVHNFINNIVYVQLLDASCFKPNYCKVQILCMYNSQ